MTTKFKIGDRVVITRKASRRYNEHGIICRIPGQHGESYGVRLDNPLGESDCDGTCESNHGWNIMAEYMAFEDQSREEVDALFPVGSRVIRISKGKHSWSSGGPAIDTTGTVRGTYYHDEALNYSVEWDDFKDGHNCDGAVESNRGFWVYPDEITLLEELPEIDIFEVLGV